MSTALSAITVDYWKYDPTGDYLARALQGLSSAKTGMRRCRK